MAHSQNRDIAFSREPFIVSPVLPGCRDIAFTLGREHATTLGRYIARSRYGKVARTRQRTMQAHLKLTGCVFAHRDNAMTRGRYVAISRERDNARTGRAASPSRGAVQGAAPRT